MMNRFGTNFFLHDLEHRYGFVPLRASRHYIASYHVCLVLRKHSPWKDTLNRNWSISTAQNDN